jgi:L-lactate dehydrogenase complex protein LldG
MSPSARDIVLGSVRRALAVTGGEAPRRSAVADRLRGHRRGLLPARGQLAAAERLALFRNMVEEAAGTTEHLPNGQDVPAAVANFLRGHNLPLAIRRGGDPRLANLPWERARPLEVATGASDGRDLAALSHAFGAAAESGTLMLVSGADNPTTLNFLPDVHIVVLNAKDVAGDYETLWERLRAHYGAGNMPRTVNMITGPSRSADIEQTLILGAHGPRRLHVIIVGEPD